MTVLCQRIDMQINMGTTEIKALLFVVLMVEVTSGEGISINKDLTGEKGSNGTYIECLINMDGVLTVNEVSIWASLKGSMSQIITFLNSGITGPTKSGEYLKDRVTYNTITPRTNRTILQFTQLLCEDDTEYQCRLTFTPDPLDQPQHNSSDISHLVVTVLPLKPVELTVLKINGTVLSNNSDINYVHNLTFIENDTITAFCGGQVGKPPANLTMQLIQSDGASYSLTSDNSPVNVEMPNCSFYQNNSFTTNLTDRDNESIFRCAVGDSQDMFIQTSQIIVLFPVRTPVITTNPYPPTKMPPLTLRCRSRGNPEPDYAWFKLNETVGFEWYASAQNITLNSTADRGVYRCDVNNSINKVYKESSNITVKFEVATKAPVSTTVLTSTQATSTESTNKDNNNELLDKGIYIGLGVLGVIIIIVIIVTVCVKMRAKKPDENLVHSLGTMEKIGTDNYYDIDLQTRKSRNSEDVRKEIEDTKKHNESYLKDQAADNSQVNQQPVEYAAVNKPKKGAPYQNTHIHQPAEYAQVNKLSRKPSSEPPPDYDDDPYASGQGIYDHANDRRHKKMQDTENYDTAASVTNGKSAKHQTNLGSVVDPTAEPLKQGHVASDRQSRTITKLESNLAETLESKTSL